MNWRVVHLPLSSKIQGGCPTRFRVDDFGCRTLVRFKGAGFDFSEVEPGPPGSNLPSFERYTM